MLEVTFADGKKTNGKLAEKFVPDISALLFQLYEVMGFLALATISLWIFPFRFGTQKEISIGFYIPQLSS
jgi:hypothetical protein